MLVLCRTHIRVCGYSSCAIVSPSVSHREKQTYKELKWNKVSNTDTVCAFHYNPIFGLWCFLHLRWPAVYTGGGVWGMHRLYTFLNKLCISTKLFKWTQRFGRNEFIFTKCFQLQVRFDKTSIYDYILGDFLTLQMIYFIKMFIRIHL